MTKKNRAAYRRTRTGALCCDRCDHSGRELTLADVDGEPQMLCPECRHRQEQRKQRREAQHADSFPAWGGNNAPQESPGQ